MEFMNEVQKRADLIIKDFADVSSWEERYKKIIHAGRSLAPLDEKYKQPDWLVKGCQSQVWLYAFKNKEGRVVFQADSDALITKGLVALLLRYYSDLTPEDILSHSIPIFFKKLELENHLSPTRVGGLFSLIRQIQYYAKAFSLMSKT